MSELIRKPYKITLWEDKNRYIKGLKFRRIGDINDDNLLDIQDIAMTRAFVLGVISLAEEQKYFADIDKDGIVTENDVNLIDKIQKNQPVSLNPSELGYYELNNNEYVLTQDIEFNNQKIYYNSINCIQNQYLEEVCIATIGSNTMDTPIRAFNPILTEELNGSKIFTFQINYRYWDDDEEEFKLNPFISLLVNERKVKLQYDGEWYDFVIKQIDEDSESNTFTYTCKDLFINELGKTGYEVELDTELRNNMGTITELANSILEGTDWQVDEENCDDLIQRNKEGLYSCITESSIEATDVLTQSPKTIPSGKVIFVFYSCKANSENPIQFLYKEQNQSSSVDEAIANFYKVDEYGFIVDANNYEFTYNGTLSNFYNRLTSSSYFGQKIIKKQEMHYLPQIDETCTVWTHYDEVLGGQLGDVNYDGVVNEEDANLLARYLKYHDVEINIDLADVNEDNNIDNKDVSRIYRLIAGEDLPKYISNPQESGWYELIDNQYILSEDTEINSEKKYYKKNRYYCYSELEYASIAQVQNMLSNSSGFISTNGWVGDSNQDVVTLTTTGSNPVLRSIGLNGNIYNTGFYDNRAALSPKGFIKNEKYIVAVKGITLTNNPYITLIGKTGISNVTPLTFNKSFDNQTYPFTIPSELEDYSVKMAVCSETISYSSIINNYGDIRFYLNNNGNLVDCKVFKYRTDSEDKMIVPDLEKDSNAIIQTRYNFFLKSSIPNNAIYTKQDLTIAESLLDTTEDYEPVMIDGCKKVTSLTGSKSNRFNLIQSLCEVFECWAKFTIEHNDKGQIIYSYIPLNEEEYIEGGRYYQKLSDSEESSDDTLFQIYSGTTYISDLYKKIYHKYITFKEYIGDDNPIGFRYGINLQSIQRNIISDQIASKVIVQANSNEFAPNGSCTIQQSVLNPTGENALYNFQYFINHGLLDAASLYDDLYGTNGGLGFYTKMKEYNDSIQPKINELSEISKSLYTLNSRQTVYDALMEEASRLRDEASLELSSAGYSSSSGTVPTYITELRNEIESYENTMSYYSTLSIRNKGLLDAYTQKYNTINESLKVVRILKDKLNQDFANKYYRFIQEGTWNSEDYWDPELYYQAANMVLYTSSFPQISYSINVLELSQIEGFEAYKFKIADKTYIEDTEFFGYDSKGRPYKEEIVVSQIKRHLDDNSQNTITVQNYKTQFQDLFQRIAAASQSLQYHEGSYQRAASAINNDGTINSALLQNSLEANALVIQNANNQSVTWDETGITISNFVNANEIVRLTSSGIVLSTDGGKSWTTGITGNGINADVITAGRIDTDRIRIFNGAMQQTFEWNSSGINAYMQGGSFIDNGTTIGLEANQVNYGKFVRFDQYGLYGYAGGNPAWDPKVEDNGSIGINKVIRDSIFSLTWKGLNIKTGAQGGFLPIDTPSGNPSAQMWYESSSNGYVLTDDTEVESGKTYYKSDNEVINVNDKFKVDGQGNITLAGSITLAGNITWSSTNMPQTSVTGQNVYDAITNSIGTEENQGLFYGIFNTTNGLHINANSINTGTLSSVILNINNRFHVDSNGNMWIGTETSYANASTFKVSNSGNIVAQSGRFEDNIYLGSTNSRNNKISKILEDLEDAIDDASDAATAAQDAVDAVAAKLDAQNSDYGGINYISGSGTSQSGYGVKMYSSDGPYVAATENGSSLVYDSSHQFYVISNGSHFVGTVYQGDTTIHSSDQKMKKNIEYNLDNYENFILDLKPCRFQFIDGQSGRYHLGFIAQDVEDNLIKNNLLSTEFAGWCKWKDISDDSSEVEAQGLRYGEFIALNTYMIQKLESRISTLENLISSQNSDIL